jgi:putative hemin transport protein
VSNLDAYERLVRDFTHRDQAPGERVEARPAASIPRADAAVDVEGLRRAWAAMKDTHEFFGMLKQFGAARTQALRLAGPDFARRADKDATRRVLEAAAAEKTEIMVFVGNRGCIQIHTGPVANVRPMHGWLNVMDPGFNLHLREDRIAESWVVEKPTADGVVTSVEIFDADGETIALLFGKRKPGIPESGAWRELVHRLFPA